MSTLPEVTLTTTLVARADLLSCEIGSDGVVLLDPEAGVYLGVDGPAALMWSLLARPVSVGTLCAAVVDEYEVTEAQCEHDVRAFVEDLLRRDLVSAVDAAEDSGHAP